MMLAHPQYLWLFLLYIPLIAWYVMKHRKAHPALKISSTAPFQRMGRPLKQLMMHGLFGLRLLAIGCLIIVLCRPQSVDRWRSGSTEGTDIVLALDISTSMLAKDFNPNRLEAAKEVASQFIAGREGDNIGIVIFAGESLTGVPMTLDRPTLLNYLHAAQPGMIEDGTAIGNAIATSINRINDGKAKSKSIILLTDGSNNAGSVAPLTAAEIAKQYGIKVYTIGVGSNGYAPVPTQIIGGQFTYTNQKVEIDEDVLMKIADSTGGKYFRATSDDVLRDVFDEIDKLEKTEMDVESFAHTDDDYMVWAWIAFGLFALEIILRNTYLRTIP